MKIKPFNDTIQEMSLDIVEDSTINGECSNCGDCCGNFLPVSAKELKTIHRYVKKKHIREQKHIYPMANAVLDWTCPFRDNVNHKCTIYEVRPEICRCFKCDKPRPDMERDRALFHHKYKVVDMRAEFYNREEFGGLSSYLGRIEIQYD